MMRNALLRLLVFGTPLCLVACAAPDATEDAVDRAVVAVDGGEISGAPSSLSEDVWVYRGIPFAAPPVSDLRWRPPEPPEPWDGVRDATVAAPACIQAVAPVEADSFYDPGVDETSEDCLYLNIWSAAAPDDRAPVMVWIHGGGHVVGNGADIAYDGTALA